MQQPVIARLEKGNTRTQIDTLLKILHALGKTLAVVDIKKNQCGLTGFFQQIFSEGFKF